MGFEYAEQRTVVRAPLRDQIHWRSTRSIGYRCFRDRSSHTSRRPDAGVTWYSEGSRTASILKIVDTKLESNGQSVFVFVFVHCVPLYLALSVHRERQTIRARFSSWTRK